jgi:hypothetical protein
MDHQQQLIDIILELARRISAIVRYPWSFLRIAGNTAILTDFGPTSIVGRRNQDDGRNACNETASIHPHRCQTPPGWTSRMIPSTGARVRLGEHRSSGLIDLARCEEIWSPGSRKRLNRVTARVVPDSALHHLAVVAHARLVIIGSDSQRPHEEILAAGGPVREGRFSRFSSLNEMQGVLDEVSDEEPSEAVKQKLLRLWPQVRQPIHQALEARMRDRRDGLEKMLAERADKEVSDITAILTELERAIRHQLSGHDELRQDFLPGLAPAEQDQFERNVDALRRRLGEIPGEVRKETEAIRARFADPQPRMFPVAVTFLVPSRLL